MDDSKQQRHASWHGSEDFFRQIVEETWDMYGVLDNQGDLLYASAGFDRVIGNIPKHAEEIWKCIHSEYRMDARKLFLQCVQTGEKGRMELKARKSDDSSVWLEAVALPLEGPDGRIERVTFVCNDITAKKKHENRLVALAYHDPLTGLPNRRLFKEHLNQALSQAKRSNRQLALMYLDIDDFKLINDTMGHDVGDRFLQEFAERIRGCLREIDTFARMGGDEFTILLPSFEAAENVEIVANRIFRYLEKPWEIEQFRFHATISMGIVMFPEDGSDANILLKQVDMAMYQVKGTGRNHYQYYRT